MVSERFQSKFLCCGKLLTSCKHAKEAVNLCMSVCGNKCKESLLSFKMVPANVRDGWAGCFDSISTLCSAGLQDLSVS